MDVEHLSYPVRKKTERIVDLKKKLDTSKKKRLLPASLTGMFTCYIVFFSQRYSNYALATFNPGSKISSNFLIIDIAMILLLLYSCFIMYKSFRKYNDLKSSYESLRKDLIKSIDADFCKCSLPEACKDEYIEEMEKYGIDLVF